MSNLLPPNATAQEHALDDAIAVSYADIAVPIKTLWNPRTCPVALLPWLAWTLSVDEWDDTWTEQQQRNMCAVSYEIHAHKGTPHAIRTALAALGYDNITIRESQAHYHNNKIKRDGTVKRGIDRFWPMFDVILNIGAAPDAAMIQKIRDRIERYKNARSVLRNLIFMNIYHNNTIVRDGTYKHNGGAL